jgi:hypothetical protein
MAKLTSEISRNQELSMLNRESLNGGYREIAHQSICASRRVTPEIGKDIVVNTMPAASGSSLCAMTGTNVSMLRVIEKNTVIAGMTTVIMVTEVTAITINV